MKNYDFTPDYDAPNKFNDEGKMREREVDYLSPEDKIVLRRGLEKLWEFFHSLKVSELPTDIVFPEAAARPLFYAVKPLIDLVYTEKGLLLPQFHFVVVHSKQRNLEEIDFLERDLGEKVDIESIKSERINEGDEDMSEWDDAHFLTAAIQEKKESLLIHNETRKPEDLNNVNELIYKNHLSLGNRLTSISPTGRERILIIDDFVDKHTTFDILEEAILENQNIIYEETEDSTSKLPTFFAFYGKRKEIKNTAWESEREGMPIVFGSDQNTKGLEKYQGFRYRDDSSYNPIKSARYRKGIEAALGVKKYLGEGFVSKAENRNPDKMEALRDFLKYQGEHFVEEMRKKSQAVKW